MISFYTRIKAPCAGCDDRHDGCHGTCERYKEYRVKLETEKTKVKQKIQYETAMYASYEKELSRKLKKKKRKG